MQTPYFLRFLVSFVFVSHILVMVTSTVDPQTAGTEFLRSIEQQDGIHKLPSGVLFRVLEKGNGQRSPNAQDVCRIHYAGTLQNGTTFDSSYDRSTPLTIAPNQVIPGWTEVLQMMTVGDIWQVYIPFHLAYGARGHPPVIPAYASLIFKIEFIELMGNKGRTVQEARAELKEKIGKEYEEL